MPGSGSLYRRERTRPNGEKYVRWVASVSVGPRGARKVTRRVARTKGEASRLLEEMLKPPQLELALGAYLHRWLDETARPSVSANTARGYEHAIASWSPIAHVLLPDLTPEMIESTANRMVSRKVYLDDDGQPLPFRPASPKTVRNAQAMLRTALDTAVERGYLRDNPARRVKLRKVPRHHVEAMTPERARAVLEAVKGDRYEAAYALAMTGLRVGEVLGLAWEDVDLDARSALVRWQLVGSGEKARRAELKTAASHAPVPLPGFVVDRLRAHRAAQLEERMASGTDTEEGLVFVTPRGLPVNATWLTKHFQALLTDAGLPSMRLHDLRHAAASLLIEAGAHPKVAQALLRHATSRTTMEVYSHSTAAQSRAAADALDALLGS